jgi:DNA polymerase-3 subunit gamma/tau
LGKTTTARIFAKGLVCEQGLTAEPCNRCEQCVAVSEGRSVDVIEIDGASNNSVESIRNLREQVHYLPQSARRKVYIIDEVHMLTTSAFNALLKTLEEPPSHVNFIFATTEPQKVLPTILSRVSRLDFRRVSDEELIAHLRGILEQEGLAVEDGGLRIVARAAGGSVRDSLTLLDQVVAFAEDSRAVSEAEVRALLGQADRAAVAALVAAVLARDPDGVIARFDGLVTAGHDLMVLSMQVLEHLRDLTLVKVCRSRDVLRGATDSEYERLREQAAEVDAVVLGQSFDRFTRIVDRLPTSRVPRMLIEMGLLELVHGEPLVPLSDLLERLDALGNAGGPSGTGSAPVPAGNRRGPDRAPRRSAEAAGPPRPASPQPPPVAPVERTPSFGESPLMQGLWNLGKESGVFGQREAAASQGAASEPPAVNPPTAAGPAGSPCCEPSAPALGAIDLDQLQPFAAWEALVDRIRGEDEYVSAVLCQVGLVALQDGLLEVAAPRGSFAHTELSGRPEIRARVEQATRDHFGRPFQLLLAEGEPNLPELPSIVSMHARRREEHRQAIEAEARAHGGIRSVLDTFNARIAVIKPLHEP